MAESGAGLGRGSCIGQAVWYLGSCQQAVIWLVVGNTSTAEILRILMAHATAIEAFITEPITSLLTLRKP
jgi:predicted nuclease of predicted toxin-antitoxin system